MFRGVFQQKDREVRSSLAGVMESVYIFFLSLFLSPFLSSLSLSLHSFLSSANGKTIAKYLHIDKRY